MQIRNEAKGTWYDAFVDAHSGELVHVTDFVAKASVNSPALSYDTTANGGYISTLSSPYKNRF